jgi:hypothetical protein
MLSFLDRAFCASKVKKHTCGRELTPELKKQAEKWWGGKDYPVAYGLFCEAAPSKKGER